MEIKFESLRNPSEEGENCHTWRIGLSEEGRRRSRTSGKSDARPSIGRADSRLASETPTSPSVTQWSESEPA